MTGEIEPHKYHWFYLHDFEINGKEGKCKNCGLNIHIGASWDYGYQWQFDLHREPEYKEYLNLKNSERSIEYYYPGKGPPPEENLFNFLEDEDFGCNSFLAYKMNKALK